jgi:hypothetical protein
MNETKSQFRFLDIKGLVGEYQNNTITELTKFKYLLAEFLLMLLTAYANVQLPPEPGLYWTVTTTALLLITGFGTWYCFKVNSEGDNTDFSSRYIALNFVVSMRFAVAFVGFLLAIVILAPLLPTTMLDETQYNLALNLSVMTVMLGLYFYYIAKYMKQIAGVTQNDTVETITQ